MSEHQQVDLTSTGPTPPARLNRVPLSRRHWLWMGVLGFGYVMETFDNAVFSYLAPAVQAEWGLSLTQVGYIVSATFVGMTIGAVLGGRLSDRFGRRRILIWSSVLYSLASLLSAISPNYEVLFASRVITGIGVQAATGVMMVYIAEMYPSASRGRFFTIFTFFGNVASPLTSFVALTLAPGGDGGWRWVFVIGTFGVIVAVMAAIWLPDTVRWLHLNGHRDEANRIVGQLEAAALQAGRELPPASATVEEIESRGTLKDLLTRQYTGRLIVVGLTFAMFIYCLYGFLNWVPTVLVAGGMSEEQALTLSTIMSFGAPIALVLYPLVDRVERKTMLFALSMISAVAVALFGLSNSPVLLTVTGGILLIALCGASAAFYTYMPEVFPTRVRGVGAGIVNGAGRIAGIVSGLTISGIFGALGATGLYLFLAGGFVLLGVIVLVWGPRTTGLDLEDIAS